tara:strand:+ start:942 stop:1220 length:279 start_codon:yes stop_codon:yes gene_type:complete
MEIRTATALENEIIRNLEPRHGRAKGAIRLRIEEIGDEIAVFGDCCNGKPPADGCIILQQTKSAITNVQLKSEKRFRHTHRDRAVYVWKVKG